MRKPSMLSRAALAVLLLVTVAGAGRSHPMGNFTVNRYTRLTLAPGALRLHYVLDLAELPTITERQDMDADGDSDITDAETKAYLATRVPGWLAQLKATGDGKPLAWDPRGSRLEFTAGVANLPVMRVEVDAAAPLAAGQREIAFEDGNYKDRLGWKEVVLVTAKGVSRPAGTEALADASRELRAYPEAMMDAPLQVSTARFTADVPAPPTPVQKAAVALAKPAPKPKPAPMPKPTPKPVVEKNVAPAPVEKPAPAKPPVVAAVTPVPTAKPAVVAPPAPAPVIAETPAAVPAVGVPETRAPMSGSSSRWSRAFHDLVGRKTLTPGALAVALLIAFFLGALHALQPGHGKTLVAAYLVGQHGTAKHAALLGLTVTITHTFGVFVLGAVALYASKYILPQDLFPWMGFASGALIAALGIAMLTSRLQETRRQGHAHVHEHEHDHVHEAVAAHAHSHAHSHEHGHTHDHSHAHSHDHGGLTHSHGPMGEHTHAVPDHISIKSLLALGIGGGIVPCWDALIVLLAAISLHRVGFGLLLIVAFSAGLAATLTAAGLAVVWGQNRLGMSRLTPDRVRVVSMVSHVAITLIGIFIAWQSLASAGII